MARQERIVITGLAVLSSLGYDSEAVWSRIHCGDVNVSLEKIDVGGERWIEYFIHRIKDFKVEKFGLQNDLLNEILAWKKNKIPLDLLYLSTLTKLALNDSYLKFSKDKNNIGLVLTCEGPGLEDFFSKVLSEAFKIRLKSKGRNDQKLEFFKKMYDRCARSGYDLQTFMHLFFVSKILCIHGYSLFINNACSSGLYALEAAANIIQRGLCPAVAVVGADHADAYKYLWFKNQNMYSKNGVISPFSLDANGYVFGDGGGALILESYQHAIKRKAKIYGEYLGGYFNSQGWKVTLPAIHKNYYSSVITSALKRAELRPENIDLICAHGVGLKITDHYEAKSIASVFGKNGPPVTALKPYFGHNLGGNAILESAILLLSMKKGIAPKTLNSEKFDNTLGINLLRKELSVNLINVMKICTGFAGFEGSVIFRNIKNQS